MIGKPKIRPRTVRRTVWQTVRQTHGHVLAHYHDTLLITLNRQLVALSNSSGGTMGVPEPLPMPSQPCHCSTLLGIVQSFTTMKGLNNDAEVHGAEKMILEGVHYMVIHLTQLALC